MRKKKNKAGLTGKAKRFAALALAGCMLYCGGVQANAATLKDVFDEHYYADQYPDLKEVYGYDREALWQHFTTHGLSEGRNMNGLIDIVKYREMYSDLDAAFGDNWNAYLNHYLTFGAKENRETGTDSNFNALDYAGRYEDLQAAYGTNVLALWNHYQAFGATEGREARDESIVQAEMEEEEEEKEAAAKAEEENGEALVTLEIDKSKTKIEWYPNGGTMKTATLYAADGSKVKELEWDKAMYKVKEVTYYTNGSYTVEEFAGEWRGAIRKRTEYNADGSVRQTIEYNRDGTVKK